MNDRWIVFDLIGVLAEPSWRDLVTLEQDAWAAFKLGQKSESEFWGKEVASLYRSMLAFRQDRLDYVRSLKKRGFKICVATNFSRVWLDHLLAKIQTPNLFDAAVVSSEVGAAKPDPEFWVQVLKYVPKGSVFVDDRKANCDGASDAGLDVVWAHPACALENEIERRLGA